MDDEFDDLGQRYLMHGMSENLVLKQHVMHAAVEESLREFRREGHMSVEVAEAARAKAGRFLLDYYRARLPVLMKDLEIASGHASQH